MVKISGVGGGVRVRERGVLSRKDGLERSEPGRVDARSARHGEEAEAVLDFGERERWGVPQEARRETLDGGDRPRLDAHRAFDEALEPEEGLGEEGERRGAEGGEAGEDGGGGGRVGREVEGEEGLDGRGEGGRTNAGRSEVQQPELGRLGVPEAVGGGEVDVELLGGEEGRLVVDIAPGEIEEHYDPRNPVKGEER